MRKTRLQILLDPEAKKMLERYAKIRNTSVGQVIREAVELYGKEKVGSCPKFHLEKSQAESSYQVLARIVVIVYLSLALWIGIPRASANL